MPIIKPIPLHLLIHQVEYEEYLGEDDWEGGSQYEAPINLKNVRLEYSSELNRNNNSEQITYQARLFFDAHHSRPQDVNFVEKSKVTFNGDEMFVKEVHPIYDVRLHHYEVVLI